jgi:hypothetical protein
MNLSDRTPIVSRTALIVVLAIIVPALYRPLVQLAGCQRHWLIQIFTDPTPQ